LDLLSLGLGDRCGILVLTDQNPGLCCDNSDPKITNFGCFCPPGFGVLLVRPRIGVDNFDQFCPPKGIGLRGLTGRRQDTGVGGGFHLRLIALFGGLKIMNN
jgi:hypothetical protein